MNRHLATIAGTIIFLTGNLLAEAPADITFVGYNLKNYLKMDRRVDGEFKRQADKPEKEVAALIEMIKATSPDILGLVEIGTEADLKDLQTRLQAAGSEIRTACESKISSTNLPRASTV